MLKSSERVYCYSCKMSTMVLKEDDKDKTEVPPPPIDGSVSDDSVTTSNQCKRICRICRIEECAENELVSPCLCKGSMLHVHQSCLKPWVVASNTTQCEICKYTYIMDYIIPFVNLKYSNITACEWKAFMSSCHIFTVSIAIINTVVLLITVSLMHLEGYFLLKTFICLVSLS